MTRADLVSLLSDHGEHYDNDAYYGCDCGLACSAHEHPGHVADVLISAAAVTD